MTATPSVIFGVPIDSYTMDQTIDRIGHLIDLGRRDLRTHQVATVNVDFLVNAITNPAVMKVLQRADLNIADGMPVVWAARALGSALPERVAGADLVPALAAASAERGWKIHLFGGAPGVGERARAIMLATYPDSVITADAGPPVVDANSIDERVADSIRALDPDILCVALGNPKQERFIDTYREIVRCPVMIGIGGSLDMLVGDKQRAPQWAQRIGAEWLFRAAQEPRRLGRRYAHDIATFGPQLAAYYRTARKYRWAGSLSLRTENDLAIVESNSGDAIWPDVPTAGFEERLTAIDLRLGGVEGITPRAHARLVGLLRDAHLHDLTVRWHDVHPSLHQCLAEYRTARWFGTDLMNT